MAVTEQDQVVEIGAPAVDPVHDMVSSPRCSPTRTRSAAAWLVMWQLMRIRHRQPSYGCDRKAAAMGLREGCGREPAPF
jgi:hypothetical protein